MTMPALFAVESGASVKQVQPPVIQGKRQDETLLSGMILFCPSTHCREWPSLDTDTWGAFTVATRNGERLDLPVILIKEVTPWPRHTWSPRAEKIE